MVVMNTTRRRSTVQDDHEGCVMTWCRLYACRSVDREIFNEEATKIRASFDKFKDLPAESG